MTGARQFTENHFAVTTFGRIRLLVDGTFRQVQHKSKQLFFSVQISFDQIST